MCVIFLAILVLEIVGGGCGIANSPASTFDGSSWVELTWTGEPVTVDYSSESPILSQLLDVDDTSFIPERILGGPGIRTMLQFDPNGLLVGIHTTYNVNKQWVVEPLPISDAFFLEQTRVSALLLASPTSQNDDGMLEVTDQISGTWRYGYIQIEATFTLSGIRLDQLSSGSLTQTATFTVVDTIPSSLLLGFPGIEAGKTLTYQFVIPIEFRPSRSPEVESFRQTEVIVTPAGTLPRDIGIQEGALARRLQALGRL